MSKQNSTDWKECGKLDIPELHGEELQKVKGKNFDGVVGMRPESQMEIDRTRKNVTAEITAGKVNVRVHTYVCVSCVAKFGSTT